VIADLHVEALAPARDGAADAPEPDDAELLPTQARGQAEWPLATLRRLAAATSMLS